MSLCVRETIYYMLAPSSNREPDAAHDFYESLGFAQHGLSSLVEP